MFEKWLANQIRINVSLAKNNQKAISNYTWNLWDRLIIQSYLKKN